MPRALRAVLVTLVIGGLVVAARRLNLWEQLSVESMRAVVDSWGALGPLVFIAIFVAGFFIPGPEILLVAIGGMLFGATRGFAYAWAAAVVGTAATFLLVRYTAQAWAQRALEERFPRLRALDDRLERHGVLTVVVLRLLLFLAPPLNWALGASRVRTLDYVVGTALGVLPGIGLTVVLADRITAAGSGAGPLGPDVVVPAAIIALQITVGIVLGRRLLGGASAAREETSVRQVHRRAAGQHRAVEPGQQGGGRAPGREAEEPGQPLH